MKSMNRLILGLVVGLVAAPIADAQTLLPIEIQPVDRLQSDLRRQLALVNTLAEINTKVVELGQPSPDMLVLLDESQSLPARVKALLEGGGAGTASEVETLQIQVAILQNLMQAQIESDDAQSVPAPATGVLSTWTLTRHTIRYVQLPDENIPGQVVLDTGRALRTLKIGQRSLLNGKSVALESMRKTDETRIELGFRIQNQSKIIVY